MPDESLWCDQVAQDVIEVLELELIVYDNQGHQRGVVAKKFKTAELGMAEGRRQTLLGPQRLDPPGVQHSEAAVMALIESKLSALKREELMKIVVISRIMGGDRPVNPDSQALITLASRGIRKVISATLITPASNS